ncbi:TetR/AcrR family transcriptional regulator [Marinomonas sp. TW1]|uniref:TetR/AcrR family transcriptional regulator n=1 Tax=Marinomonas sp. TW1 TaxID=1561203 RepID=UPI0007AF7F2C|nr:TetR/AcrR family transcriptional regulator [Marinomonas sp. TW1]KZN14270.1 transcriptional regulator [Marinomonas sp. TW1]
MNTKRQLLINTALELFYQQGIHVIGINEVLKQSGIAKKTLYHHFDSKDALILAALQQRHEVFYQWLESKLNQADSDESMIEALFYALESWVSGKESVLGHFRGCFFVNSAVEFSAADSQIAQYCQYHKAQVKKLIGQGLQKQSIYLLDMVCLLKEGFISQSHVNQQAADAQACINTAKLALKTLSE